MVAGRWSLVDMVDRTTIYLATVRQCRRIIEIIAGLSHTRSTVAPRRWMSSTMNSPISHHHIRTPMQNCLPGGTGTSYHEKGLLMVVPRVVPGRLLLYPISI
eukprot:scaffold2339_cov54-Attheya_sp.AAC.7